MRADVDFSLVNERIELGEAGDPMLARAWLGAAATLAGPDAPERQLSAYDVRVGLAWIIFASRWMLLARDRILPRAIEEGRRVQLDLPPQPQVDGVGPFLNARRRVVSSTLRLIYRSWRHSAL